ncbi:hypothetical protein TNCV_1034531 [Trichonephila clavipes]|nr:hypothetical protein TNCV_1034531 [Trichonephila clavipes]
MLKTPTWTVRVSQQPVEMPDILPDVDAELGTALVSQQLCVAASRSLHCLFKNISLRSSACGNVSLNLATFIARAELEHWERLDLRFRV